ncbi:MAG: KH domain-containing protein [Candidatus Beckwithbacteria bacterium]|nr:KH domain-containing protein [Candidatus Beckwithbacteria bacterium]
MEKSTEKNIAKLTKQLLSQLGVEPTKITISSPEPDSYLLDLELADQEMGMLIGYHGDTISALQLMLNLLLYRQKGEWCKLVVNIGDYRQKREETLIKLAQDTAQRVKFSGQPMALFNLNPFERHTIHAFLSTDPKVATESEGEGRNRHLIVKPASAAVASAKEAPSSEVGPKQE